MVRAAAPAGRRPAGPTAAAARGRADAPSLVLPLLLLPLQDAVDDQLGGALVLGVRVGERADLDGLRGLRHRHRLPPLDVLQSVVELDGAVPGVHAPLDVVDGVDAPALLEDADRVVVAPVPVARE